MSSMMGTKNLLDELDINPCIAIQANKAGYVTASKILGASQTELERKLDLSAFHIKNLISTVASHVVPPKTTAWEMTQECSKKATYLTTGCAQLDDFLGGGVKVGSVTEVTGQSSSGKTQLALQLSLHAQLPQSYGGLSSGVAYICTEAQFPVGRLQQMIPYMRIKYPSGPHSYTDTIFVHHASNLDDLVDFIKYQLPLLISRHGVKVVIIDSIAASYRAEDAGEINKNAILQSTGYTLNKLATLKNLAVVVINQVTATIGSSLYGITGDISPALGLSWANLITTRLMLSRTHANIPANQAPKSTSIPMLSNGYKCSNDSQSTGNNENKLGLNPSASKYSSQSSQSSGNISNGSESSANNSNGYRSNSNNSNGCQNSADNSNGSQSSAYNSNGYHSNSNNSNADNSNRYQSNEIDSNGCQSNASNSNGCQSNADNSNGCQSNANNSESSSSDSNVIHINGKNNATFAYPNPVKKSSKPSQKNVKNCTQINGNKSDKPSFTYPTKNPSQFSQSRTKSHAGTDNCGVTCDRKVPLAVKYNIRLLEVIFCPWLARKSAAFIVTEEGVKGIEFEGRYRFSSVLRNDYRTVNGMDQTEED